MSTPGTSLLVRLEQIRVALDNLAALVPPTYVYDEEGNNITDPALITAYEEAYAALRLSIITAAGPDFSTGISLTGYDPAGTQRGLGHQGETRFGNFATEAQQPFQHVRFLHRSLCGCYRRVKSLLSDRLTKVG